MFSYDIVINQVIFGCVSFIYLENCSYRYILLVGVLLRTNPFFSLGFVGPNISVHIHTMCFFVLFSKLHFELLSILYKSIFPLLHILNKFSTEHLWTKPKINKTISNQCLSKCAGQRFPTLTYLWVKGTYSMGGIGLTAGELQLRGVDLWSYAHVVVTNREAIG